MLRELECVNMKRWSFSQACLEVIHHYTPQVTAGARGYQDEAGGRFGNIGKISL